MLKQKLARDISLYKTSHFFGVYDDVTINASLHNLLVVFTQKPLVVETRLSALSGDINKMISIKLSLQLQGAPQKTPKFVIMVLLEEMLLGRKVLHRVGDVAPRCCTKLSTGRTCARRCLKILTK